MCKKLNTDLYKPYDVRMALSKSSEASTAPTLEASKAEASTAIEAPVGGVVNRAVIWGINGTVNGCIIGL